ncbi:MAG: acyl-CoA dehydratase activase-related protein, partial [Oscillospiraceae bacterium]|nr:acyl-CoA dehydratase activase-related protein [Oscillospiraceae bacterium]
AVLSAEELERFTHSVKAVTCSGCGNHCNLTVNDFGGGRRFIAGNRCDRPVSGKPEQTAHYDLYDYKLSLLEKYRDGARDPAKPTIGIPLGLNFYELLPFWRTFWEALGFNVIVSPLSTRELYLRGQYTIPSDTACYPAKLMHGHMEALLDQQPDAIFYPDMSHNAEEGLGVNHFNCPVVAYYPQVLRINVPRLGQTVFIDDFVSIADRTQFTKRMGEIVKKYFPAVPKKSIKPAAQRAYEAYDQYFRDLRQKGQEYLDVARAQGLPVIVLAGRPYHVDPEINHGIHTLICRLGAVVLTEDSVSHLVQPFPVDVRNQWTYHARLYAAAKFVASAPPEASINLVQLVSFGCGVDAVTTDEVRAILERSGKIYTQIKIDEISNMGAVNIRLRSLFSAIEDRERSHPA